MPLPKRKPEEKMTSKQILKLVDKLSLKEQAKLRMALLEDQEDICIALERLANPGKIWSHEEIKKDLGLGN